MSGNSDDEHDTQNEPEEEVENGANGDDSAEEEHNSDDKANGEQVPDPDGGSESGENENPKSSSRPVRDAFCNAVSKLHKDDDVDYSMTEEEQNAARTRRSRREVAKPVSYSLDRPKMISVNLARSNAPSRLYELLKKCSINVADISKAKDRKTRKRFQKALNAYNYSKISKKLYREEQSFDALELFGLSSKVTASPEPECISLPPPRPMVTPNFSGLQPKPMAALVSPPGRDNISLPAGTTSVPIVLPAHHTLLPNQPILPVPRPINLLQPQPALPMQTAKSQNTIKMDTAVMTKVNKLVTQSIGSEVRVKSVDLIEVCRDLNECQKTIKQLKAELAYGNMGSDNIMDNNKSKQESFKMLTDIGEPKLDKNLPFQSVQGYRIVDMQLLSLSLEAAQRCGHGSGSKINIYELKPDVVHEDLASTFAFVCSFCNKATIFPSSSFSKESPKNFSINKHVLPLLGPSSYFKLAQFVQDAEHRSKPASIIARHMGLPSQLVLSVDQKSFVGSSSIDMPQVIRPSAPAPAAASAIRMPRISNIMSANPLRLPPMANRGGLFPNRLPLPSGFQRKPAPQAIRVPMNNGTTKPKGPTKIKASKELPAGSRISSVPPGTKITTSNVAYSDQERTGLNPGVYKVTKPGCTESVLVIKANNDAGPAGRTATTRNASAAVPSPVGGPMGVIEMDNAEDDVDDPLSMGLLPLPPELMPPPEAGKPDPSLVDDNDEEGEAAGPSGAGNGNEEDDDEEPPDMSSFLECNVNESPKDKGDDDDEIECLGENPQEKEEEDEHPAEEDDGLEEDDFDRDDLDESDFANSDGEDGKEDDDDDDDEERSKKRRRKDSAEKEESGESSPKRKKIDLENGEHGGETSPSEEEKSENHSPVPEAEAEEKPNETSDHDEGEESAEEEGNGESTKNPEKEGDGETPQSDGSHGTDEGREEVESPETAADLSPRSLMNEEGHHESDGNEDSEIPQAPTQEANQDRGINDGDFGDDDAQSDADRDTSPRSLMNEDEDSHAEAESGGEDRDISPRRLMEEDQNEEDGNEDSEMPEAPTLEASEKRGINDGDFGEHDAQAEAESESAGEDPLC